MASHRADSMSRKFHDRLDASFSAKQLAAYWPISQLDFFEKFTREKCSLSSLFTDIGKIKSANGIQAFFSSTDDLMLGLGEVNAT